MVITREYNVINRNGFQVAREFKVIEDSNIRITVQMQIHRREVKLYKFLKMKEKLFKDIQKFQFIALTSDDKIESRQAEEYVNMILRPELCKINNEIKALEIQIEKLRNRL